MGARPVTGSAPGQVSLRGRFWQSMIRRGESTDSIDATVARMAAAEVAGRPAPSPTRALLTGISVTEHDIAGTTVFRLRPARRVPRRAVLYLHGGAYIEDVSPGTWTNAAQFVRRTAAEVWVPAYRLAPRQTAKVTVPAMLEVYREMLRTWPSESLVVAGDSAGGGLALATVQAAIAAGEPTPASLSLFAPWVDLTGSDPHERTGLDPLLDHHRLTQSAHAYAGDLAVDDPRVSPLFGPLTGLPPITIIVGGNDILVHQNRRLHDALRTAGVTVHYRETAGMVHVYVFLPIPEARRALRTLFSTINQQTPAARGDH